MDHLVVANERQNRKYFLQDKLKALNNLITNGCSAKVVRFEQYKRAIETREELEAEITTLRMAK